MHSLSIFGTSSDAGKSTLSFAITYLLYRRGYSVAPFKAQNVSNNSLVTDINKGEIAIPQAFAAYAVSLKTTPLFNPVLIKSAKGAKAHIIINGKSVGQNDVWAYYRNMKLLKPIVSKAFLKLQKSYDIVVAEGAGSPVELNLMKKDLSNIYIAKKFNTKIILVADIQRGGVFASIYGVYHLLPKKIRKNIIGVIINKFQGDMSFFDEGVEIIQKKFGIKVLGVLPYKKFNLAFEDSASLNGYRQELKTPIIKVGLIKLPHISNFTEFEPLVADSEVELMFITTPSESYLCDLLILPGSKLVMDDLVWLRKRGFKKVLCDNSKMIVAICGGYEMMHERILDADLNEGEVKQIRGFGHFKGDVVFKKQKYLHKGVYNIFGMKLNGYEIHNGRAKKIAQIKKGVYGTFMHALFENDNFRDKIFKKLNKEYKGYSFQKYKKRAIEDFAMHVEKYVDMDHIEKELHE